MITNLEQEFRRIAAELNHQPQEIDILMMEDVFWFMAGIPDVKEETLLHEDTLKSIVRSVMEDL